MEMNKLVYGIKDFENYTVQEIIDEMKLLRCTFVISRLKPLITVQTLLQNVVMKTFGVSEISILMLRQRMILNLTP